MSHDRDDASASRRPTLRERAKQARKEAYAAAKERLKNDPRVAEAKAKAKEARKALLKARKERLKTDPRELARKAAMKQARKEANERAKSERRDAKAKASAAKKAERAAKDAALAAQLLSGKLPPKGLATHASGPAPAVELGYPVAPPLPDKWGAN
jgi:hypothetical protein